MEPGLNEIRNGMTNGEVNPHHRRGVSLLPLIFTVGNLSCGYYAVLATMRGTSVDFDNASRAIGFAILFDALDGRVARATGTSSEFGKQLDSLADVISFGVAPAFLAFAWGVKSFFTLEQGIQRDVYLLGWVVTFMFMISCAWRLARFNIQGMAPGKESKYFVGMPTPAAAGMIAASVHILKEPVQDWRFALGWLAVVALLAALMTSTIRYYGFKEISLRRRRSSLVLLPLALLVYFVWAFSEWTLFILGATYLLSGLTLHAVRLLRRRFAPAPSSSPAPPA